MKQFKVEGMTCASCQAHVEKAVAGVPGVTSVSVSLLTNSMGVEGDATNEAIIKAVEDAGYGASPKGADGTSAKPASDDALKDTETPKLEAASRLFHWFSARPHVSDHGAQYAPFSAASLP